MSMTTNLEVIECPNIEENVFVIRFPLLNNSIKIGTKLYVKQNQVAVFVDEGHVLDVLAEGVHLLNHQSLPLLAAKRNWSKRFNDSFKCEIYFVELTLFDNLKWAMVNSLIIRDNDFGSIAIKCFGNFAFKVTNAKLFMKELFGKIQEFNNEDIALYLRTLIVTGITDMLLDTRISALDFMANYDKFEMNDFQNIRDKFANCGLFLQRLNIEDVTIPEQIEKLLNTKVMENMKSTIKLPVNHPLNSGTSYTEEMQRLFNFTHDFTVNCVNCGATISRNFKYCPQCGAENKEIAKECPKCHNIVAFKANFCPDCGTKLFDKNNVVLCKHCGKIVSETDLYCPDCGKVL